MPFQIQHCPPDGEWSILKQTDNQDATAHDAVTHAEILHERNPDTCYRVFDITAPPYRMIAYLGDNARGIES